MRDPRSSKACCCPRRFVASATEIRRWQLRRGRRGTGVHARTGTAGCRVGGRWGGNGLRGGCVSRPGRLPSAPKKARMASTGRRTWRFMRVPFISAPTFEAAARSMKDPTSHVCARGDAACVRRNTMRITPTKQKVAGPDATAAKADGRFSVPYESPDNGGFWGSSQQSGRVGRLESIGRL